MEGRTMKDYEFTFDSEYGVYFGMIQAPDEKTFLKEIRKQYPNDKGARLIASSIS